MTFEMDLSSSAGAEETKVNEQKPTDRQAPVKNQSRQSKQVKKEPETGQNTKNTRKPEHLNMEQR